MSFNVALSGLRAANQDLAVTGNNIANASTTGFKQSRAEFADVYAGSIMGSGSRTPGSGVLVADIAQQFGQGNISITNNSLDFAISGEGFFVLSDQGAPVYTRAGIFGVDKNGYIVGQNNAKLQGFRADNAGNILSGAPSDMQVTTSDVEPKHTEKVNLRFNLDSAVSIPTTALGARPATISGAPVNTFDLADGNASFTITLNGTPHSITLDQNLGTTGGAPDDILDAAEIAAAINTQSGGQLSADVVDGKVTVTDPSTNYGDQVMTIADANGGADISRVFGEAEVLPGREINPDNPNTYNWSTAATVYDSLGNDHVLTTYYRKDENNLWSVYASLDQHLANDPVNPVRQPVQFLGQVEFSETGSLGSIVGAPGETALASNWVVGGGANDLDFVVDFDGSTQHGAEFSINALTQDGYAPGRLAGLTVSDTGVISARYTNGTERSLGQVALANFSNPQGMTPIGNTMWASSFDSGQPVIGAPQTASLGSIQSGALEDSNVDLSDQLVNLIIAQRNYQANAKTIETANAVTQSIINLR